MFKIFKTKDIKLTKTHAWDTYKTQADLNVLIQERIDNLEDELQNAFESIHDLRQENEKLTKEIRNVQSVTDKRVTKLDEKLEEELDNLLGHIRGLAEKNNNVSNLTFGLLDVLGYDLKRVVEEDEIDEENEITDKELSKTKKKYVSTTVSCECGKDHTMVIIKK